MNEKTLNSFSQYLRMCLGTLLVVSALTPDLYAHTTLAAVASGATGSPLDGAKTCGGSGCHTETSLINQSANVTFSIAGPSGTTYVPSTTYAITVSVASAGLGPNGFEITAENATNKVGAFAAGTNVTTVGSTAYAGQANASIATKTWTFNYTTPPPGSGPITFYVIALPDSVKEISVAYLNSFGPFTETSAGPVMMNQPTNQSVIVGQSATFDLTAMGSGLSYQWQKIAPGGTTFTNISGATSPSYTTPTTTSGDSGTLLQCQVTDSGGLTIYSNTVTLTVTTTAVSPTVTIQPADQTVSVDQSGTFSVTANGTAPLNYQWLSAPSGSATFTAVAGATDAAYTLPAAIPTDDGTNFRCVISNASGSVTSNAATLIILPGRPSIMTQPLDQAISAGQTATYSVIAQ